MKTFIEGYNLIKKKFRKSIVLLGIISIAGVALDALSIVLLLPFLELLINPSRIYDNSILNLSFFFENDTVVAKLLTDSSRTRLRS